MIPYHLVNEMLISQMSDEDKLLWMFKQVHGDIDAERGACYTEVNTDDNGKPVSVSVMKNSYVCWTADKADILFDFIMNKLGASELKKLQEQSGEGA